jgi:hypothetical protein
MYKLQCYKYCAISDDYFIFKLYRFNSFMEFVQFRKRNLPQLQQNCDIVTSTCGKRSIY